MVLLNGTDILVMVAIGVSIVNLFFALIRTYYAKFTKKTYHGSADYWASWEKRKFDVAEQVLKEMGIDSPEDLKKLVKKFNKKKSKRKNK